MKIPLQNYPRHVAEFRPAVDERLAAVQNRAHFILGPEVEEFERRFADYIGTRHCVTTANGAQAMELALRSLQAADVRRLSGICRDAKIMLIEDCAEAHGAAVDGRKVGSFGAAGCFSFYPTKNLGAYGDGGAITTDDDNLAGHLRSLRQYGWVQKYHADLPHGVNSRMDEMQASVLNAKLGRLDAMNERRRAIAGYYNAKLAGRGLHLPFAADDHFIVHHYVLRSARRSDVMRALGERGIATDVHFPVPDHRQAALEGRFTDVSLPLTEAACDEVFTVPSFAEMTDAEVEIVAGALAEFYSL